MNAELVQVISDYVAMSTTFTELRAWMYEDFHWLDYLGPFADHNSPESDIVAEVMLCVWDQEFDYKVCPDEQAYSRISEAWERVRALAG